MASNASPHHLAALGVIVVAAGSGERLGAGRPKAFVELGDRTLLEHAVRTVVSIDRPGQLVLVVPEERAAEALDIAGDASENPAWQISVVAGGRERHESVRKGLDALQQGIETVLVHDAARPLTPREVFERVIDEVQRTGDGVIPVVPVVDTLKRVDASGLVRSTADRRILAAVQTPQGFRHETLAAAHQTAQAREEGDSPANDAPTDDAEVVQRFGGTVRTVPGDARSHKLTAPEDLLMLQGLLAADSATGAVASMDATPAADDAPPIAPAPPAARDAETDERFDQAEDRVSEEFQAGRVDDPEVAALILPPAPEAAAGSAAAAAGDEPDELDDFDRLIRGEE